MIELAKKYTKYEQNNFETLFEMLMYDGKIWFDYTYIPYIKLDDNTIQIDNIGTGEKGSERYKLNLDQNENGETILTVVDHRKKYQVLLGNRNCIKFIEHSMTPHIGFSSNY